ncbi:hypothetical protein BDV37DRAFT_192819 [Aspergillus pseudonomiae]|uniref:Aminoglycoside phosphotransferase domain-containing protein n=1 Tax=Aspergillus pseudonomiae TaxID=1506151 RepID=A0A5N7DPB2_9EURO|nr:uncharacterized protein BDV37DRAFT_192819 [Aspergillus pseudonomiae]KAE8408301.1 hypothetical protein BDV37DRAFT_192819 [Aspergillus pseudonomiae]
MEGKEPVYIYVMDRIHGISYLDFILAHNSRISENSGTFSSWRRILLTDIARFFALPWNAPQTVTHPYRDGLHHQYEKELGLLLTSLPPRFCRFIQESLDSLLVILSLPMVLLHKDFGVCNIMVNETSFNLTGVIDWAEAEIAPFGLNLHSLQRFISKFHLERGWIRYNDYFILEEIFWTTFRNEAGELDDETIRVVKLARGMGLLLSCGFTSRLANEPVPAPIQDDENGAYNMLVWMGY